MKVESPRRSFWESILLIVVFISIFAFLFNSYVLEKKYLKERELYYQLMLLRSGINTFFLVEKRYPTALLELGTATYKFSGDESRKSYVERFPITHDGHIVDPFGNPYTYDKEKGWVMSTTKDYLFW